MLAGNKSSSLFLKSTSSSRYILFEEDSSIMPLGKMQPLKKNEIQIILSFGKTLFPLVSNIESSNRVYSTHAGRDPTKQYQCLTHLKEQKLCLCHHHHHGHHITGCYAVRPFGGTILQPILSSFQELLWVQSCHEEFIIQELTLRIILPFLHDFISFLFPFLVILFGSREAVKFCYFFLFGSKFLPRASSVSTGASKLGMAPMRI